MLNFGASKPRIKGGGGPGPRGPPPGSAPVFPRAMFSKAGEALISLIN